MTKKITKKQQAHAVELLKEARALLARPKGWCKRNLTRRDIVIKPVEIDSTGVMDDHPHCMLGGLRHAFDAFHPGILWCGDTAYRMAKGALIDAVAGSEGHHSVAQANDSSSTRKAQVLKWYDEAIEALS